MLPHTASLAFGFTGRRRGSAAVTQNTDCRATPVECRYNGTSAAPNSNGFAHGHVRTRAQDPERRVIARTGRNARFAARAYSQCPKTHRHDRRCPRKPQANRRSEIGAGPATNIPRRMQRASPVHAATAPAHRNAPAEPGRPWAIAVSDSGRRRGRFPVSVDDPDAGAKPDAVRHRRQSRAAHRLLPTASSSDSWSALGNRASTNPRRCTLRVACCSFFRAFDSIWRIRSRVTLKIRPVSSSV